MYTCRVNLVNTDRSINMNTWTISINSIFSKNFQNLIPMKTRAVTKCDLIPLPVLLTENSILCTDRHSDAQTG